MPFLPAGLLRAAPPGFIHVNHATISARAAGELAAEAAESGYGYVAAPVLGRPNVAAAGAGDAGDAGVRLPSGPLLQDIFGTAAAELGEDLDWAAIAEITRRRA